MSEQQPVNINFRLVKINTEDFQQFDSDKENGTLDLNFDFQFGVNNDKRFVKTVSKFNFKLDKEDILMIAVSCEFEFDEKGWEFFQKDDKIVLPKGLLTQLAGFAMNTTRGVLHAKTEGHKYNKLIIPMINGEFIKKDLEIPVNAPQPN